MFKRFRIAAVAGAAVVLMAAGAAPAFAHDGHHGPDPIGFILHGFDHDHDGGGPGDGGGCETDCGPGDGGGFPTFPFPGAPAGFPFDNCPVLDVTLNNFDYLPGFNVIRVPVGLCILRLGGFPSLP